LIRDLSAAEKFYENSKQSFSYDPKSIIKLCNLFESDEKRLELSSLIASSVSCLQLYNDEKFKQEEIPPEFEVNFFQVTD